MTFEKVFGKPPGHRPESYWQPWLGDRYGLSPSDIGDLSPRQLLDCFDHAKKRDD